MNEGWNDGVPSFIPDAEFEVLLKSGSIRSCKRMAHLDYSNLFFTDCTHPDQNAYCSAGSIARWRRK